MLLGIYGRRGGDVNLFCIYSIPYSMWEMSDRTWASGGNSWMRMVLYRQERWALLRKPDRNKKKMRSVAWIREEQMPWISEYPHIYTRNAS